MWNLINPIINTRHSHGQAPPSLNVRWTSKKFLDDFKYCRSAKLVFSTNMCVIAEYILTML